MKVIIVVGITTSGKTHMCNKLGLPTITIDDLFDYPQNIYKIEELNKSINKYKNNDTILIDGYLLHVDSMFKNISNNINVTEIEIYFLYKDLELYYEAMVIKKEQLGKSYWFKYENQPDKQLNEVIEIMQNINKILIKNSYKIKYVYRDNDTYHYYDDDEHLNNLLIKYLKSNI